MWWYRLEFFENNFTVSCVGRSLSADPITTWIYSKGSNRKFGPKCVTHSHTLGWKFATANCPHPVDLSAGDIRSQTAAEWLQIAQRSHYNGELMETTIALFEWYHRWPPTTSPPPKCGSHICPHDTRMAISPQSVMRDTLHVWFSRVFTQGRRIADRMALFRVISNPAAILENFEWPYLRKGACYPLHVKILW